MVGELTDLLLIIFVALVLWLVGLSYAYWRLLNHYKKIAKKSGGGDLLQAINEILKNEEKNRLEIKKTKDAISRIEEENLVHLQKLGVVRFNPFGETGGELSFSICLLNGMSNGFILTALHARERTRVYLKTVEKGKSKHELSVEEQKALSQAQKTI